MKFRRFNILQFHNNTITEKSIYMHQRLSSELFTLKGPLSSSNWLPWSFLYRELVTASSYWNAREVFFISSWNSAWKFKFQKLVSMSVMFMWVLMRECWVDQFHPYLCWLSSLLMKFCISQSDIISYLVLFNLDKHVIFSSG